LDNPANLLRAVSLNAKQFHYGGLRKHAHSGGIQCIPGRLDHPLPRQAALRG
jgi:hypothetical protein